MEESSIVATKHLILTHSPGILLLLCGYTEISSLLYFCTISPPASQQQAHTSLSLHSLPLIMCGERGSGTSWAFALTSCGCSLLCYTLMSQPGSHSPAARPPFSQPCKPSLWCKSRRIQWNLFSGPQSRLRKAKAWLILKQRASHYYIGLSRNSNQVT